MKIKLFSAVFLFLFCLETGVALADSSFSLYPAKKEIKLKAGQELGETIKITNRLGYPATFFISVKDFVGDTSTKPLNGLQEQGLKFEDLVEPGLTSVSLASNETKVIPLTIKAPSSLMPGSLAGLIVVRAERETKESNSSAALSSSLASLWLLKPDVAAKEDGKLISFSKSESFIVFPSHPVSFFLSFENSGNIYLNPYGLIEITNWQGKKVKAFAVDPWYVLPQSSRLREVNLAISDLGAGWYKAKAFLNRGYDNKVDTASVNFVVFSWPAFFAFILVLIILVLLMLKFFLWRKKVS